MNKSLVQSLESRFLDTPIANLSSLGASSRSDGILFGKQYNQNPQSNRSLIKLDPNLINHLIFYQQGFYHRSSMIEVPSLIAWQSLCLPNSVLSCEL